MASDQAIQRTMDELEIRNIIASLAMETDTGDLDAYAAMFAEDARVEMRGEPGQPPLAPPNVGRAAILESGKKRRAEVITGPGSGMVHAIQSSAISLTGDSAQARTYVVLFRNALISPEIMGIRIYNDTFVRTADGWKLAVRCIDPLPSG